MEKRAYKELHRNEDIHWWYVGRRVIVKKILESLSAEKQDKKILEVGCASGGNLNMLSKYGDLFAMELDDESRNLAIKRNVEKNSN